MIEGEFSRSVALAQGAIQIDQLAGGLIRRLGSFALPEPLKNTGLSLASDAAGRCLVVQVHGKTLKSHFEHVWLDDGQPERKLIGRLQFRLVTEEQKPARVVYEIHFDATGLASLGGHGDFSENIHASRADSTDTYRKIVLALINEIHRAIETVKLRH